MRKNRVHFAAATKMLNRQLHDFLEGSCEDFALTLSRLQPVGQVSADVGDTFVRRSASRPFGGRAWRIRYVTCPTTSSVIFRHSIFSLFRGSIN